MTSVTCQTAYVKCFQWSSCCSCTRVGGDGSLSAGPKCSVSLCRPRSRTALARDPRMLVYVIHLEMLPRLVQSHKPLLLLIAVPAPTIMWMAVCSKTRTVENPVFWHFFRTFPLVKELVYRGWIMRISQRNLNFHFKGQTHKSFKSDNMDGRSCQWWLRVYFKRLLSLVCL